ncbi:MAG: hypothetical protein AUH72_09840 [Acidobacteria bacterium 13_1_40CM_4_65_8]|nr:MAG: hypothetical protein AUH72_09840 [Acidobacteria bacterium 13_1_40CM_4_65_8]
MVIIATAALARADESLRIVPIVRDNKVLVTFELADAYTEPVRDAIASGLRTTLSWLDRTIVTATVTASDQFDNLTRRHTLSRTVDGRVEEVLVTDDATVAKTWLTTWNRLPLCDTSKLDSSRDYYVRISARTRPFSGSLLAWAKSITGQAKFTFVP